MSSLNGRRIRDTYTKLLRLNEADVSPSSPLTEVEDGLGNIYTIGGGGAEVYGEVIGDGSNSIFTINHNFGSRDVFVAIYSNSGLYDDVEVEVSRPDINNVTVEFAGTIPASNTFRVIVIGPGTPGGGGGLLSPLTTKGDIWTYSTADERLPVGSNGQILSANSVTSTGLEWIAAPSGGGEPYLVVNHDGVLPVASGTDSLALGENSVASANFSTALGRFCEATGDTSTAVGTGARALDIRAVALGSGFAAQDNCISIGSGSQAGHAVTTTTINSIAIGRFSSAVGRDCIAIGENTNATALNSIAIGVDSTSTADDGIAIGNSANASASDSIQLGTGTNTNASTLKFLSKIIANSEGTQLDTQATGAAPVSTPAAGSAKFDTTNNTLYIYNGTTWRSVVLT